MIDCLFIDISYTLDSASYPAGGRKLKPVRGRNYVIFIDIYLSGLLARRQNAWSQDGGNMRVIANGVNR